MRYPTPVMKRVCLLALSGMSVVGSLNAALADKLMSPFRRICCLPLCGECDRQDLARIRMEIV